MMRQKKLITCEGTHAVVLPFLFINANNMHFSYMIPLRLQKERPTESEIPTPTARRGAAWVIHAN